MWSLDCAHVIPAPMGYTNSASNQAGSNLQRFGQKLQEHPAKFMLLDWWVPSPSFRFPAEHGTSLGEMIGRHNTLVTDFHLGILSNGVSDNKGTVSSHQGKIEVLDTKVQGVNNSLQIVLSHGTSGQFICYITD